MSGGSHVLLIQTPSDARVYDCKETVRSHVKAVFAEQIGLDLDYILQISKKSQVLINTLYKTEKENVDCS